VVELGPQIADSGPLVVGIGNADRGDDAVGLIVARRLRTRSLAGARVREHDGESTSLLDCLSGVDSAYMIDACKTGQPIGTVNRFDVSLTALPDSACGRSTHGMGLADAVELARALGRLPRRCVIYAIDGRNFHAGAGVSPEVAAAAELVADLIEDELRGNLSSKKHRVSRLP
jgi:hydrogenase maturation protease